MIDEESSDGEQIAVSKKGASIEDITAMAANLKISKKRPQEERNVDMP